jgi:hypothetical protein
MEQEILALVAEIGQSLNNNYVTLSAICFLFYDVLINLDREVEHVWKYVLSLSQTQVIGFNFCPP